MHVFIYEHLCAGAWQGRYSTLHVEGQAMLEASLDDFSRCPGVRVSTLLASPLLDALRCPAAIDRHALDDPQALEPSFRRLASRADFSLVIALECKDCLARCCDWVEQEGGRLLGPSAHAVRLTADKLALAAHLHTHAIPTPPCVSLSVHPSPLALSLPSRDLQGAGSTAPLPRPSPLPPLAPPEERGAGGEAAHHAEAAGLPESLTTAATVDFPLVCKPRDGAGSQATMLVSSSAELAQAIDQARQEGWTGELLAQRFVPGLAVSVAFLAGPAERVALPAVRQHLSMDGRFHYLGGSLPLPADLDQRARRLADRAVAAVPGLFGYFGVDLVLSSSSDRTADHVIEINPRLTTSYLGLRRRASVSLAGVLLALVQGQPVPDLSWSSAPLTFQVGPATDSSSFSAAPFPPGVVFLG